jgi:hypothetical protein
MRKKVLEDCFDYSILLKEVEPNIEVWVNGEHFMTISDVIIDEVDEDKIINFTQTGYEKWGFSAPHQYEGKDWMSDGSSCKGSRE